MNNKILAAWAGYYVKGLQQLQVELEYMKLNELFEMWLQADGEVADLIDATAKSLAGPNWLTTVWDEISAQL